MEGSSVWSPKVVLLGWDGPTTARTYSVKLPSDCQLGVLVQDSVLQLHCAGTSSNSFTTADRGSCLVNTYNSLEQLTESAVKSSGRVSLISAGLCLRAFHDLAAETITIVGYHDHGSDASYNDDAPMKPSIHRMKSPFRGSVRKIACGDGHCLFLADYECYTYGTNKYGQLGIGTRSPYETVLQQVIMPQNERILDIAAGPNYSALITLQYGHVYTFGNGAYYKLGHGDDEDRIVPTRVTELEVGAFSMDGTTAGVHLIACGTWHTVVIAKGTNDVYGWGWNKFGNLGANPKQIRTNSVHRAASTSTGQGRDSDHGAQDNVSAQDKGHVEEMVVLPRRIEELDAAHILGEYSGDTIHDSKHHTGHNLPGEAGGTSVDNTVCKVTCGSRHSALLTASGRVIVMGQLGPSLISNLDSPAIYRHIARLSDKASSDAASDCAGAAGAVTTCCDIGTTVEHSTSVDNAKAGRKRPFIEEQCSYISSDIGDLQSQNAKDSSGMVVSVPQLTKLYDWHNDDSHARVLNVSKVLPGRDSAVVIDIVSSGWTLACVLE